MRKLSFILLSMVIFCGCTEEETRQDKIAHNTTSSKKVQTSIEMPVPEHSSSSLLNEEFCDCVENSNPSECYTEYKSKGYDALSLAENECYIEAKLSKHADELCNCINSIKQVSLRCDEVQKEIDKHCDKIEQQALQAYFDRLNCIE